MVLERMIFIIDKIRLFDIMFMALMPGEYHIRWRLLPFKKGVNFLFLPSTMRGGDEMFVTWELLFLFAGFMIALLTYIDNHNKKD